MKSNTRPLLALPNGSKGYGRLSQRYFISASNYSARRSHRTIFYLFRDRAELEKSIENGSIRAESPKDFVASDFTRLSAPMLKNGLAAFGPREFYHLRDGFSESGGQGFQVSLSKSDFVIIPPGGVFGAAATGGLGIRALSFRDAAFELLGQVKGVSFFRKNIAMLLGPVLPPRKYLDSASWAVCTVASRTEAFFKSFFARVSRFVSESFHKPRDYNEHED
ncbi:MAG: hypothetical protein WC506_01520 [Candidatus Micrarchaeia archaeon]